MRSETVNSVYSKMLLYGQSVVDASAVYLVLLLMGVKGGEGAWPLGRGEVGRVNLVVVLPVLVGGGGGVGLEYV